MPRSLLPLITGGRTATEGEEPLEAYSVAGCSPLPGGQGNKITGAALRTGKWKLIFDKRRKLEFLYDIETDPGETIELSGRHPEELKNLMKKLTRWIGEVEMYTGSGNGENLNMSAQDERNMRGLGYM
jgi:arylsulfatase A-like enzyme